MGITIKEIAKMAGVHRSTVDKVLHNRPGVSPAVRANIQGIIEACDYHINPIGKALKMQDKILHIGVLLPKVDALPFLKEGIERELGKYTAFHIELQYRILPYQAVAEQAEAIRGFEAGGCDGLIVKAINAPEIRGALAVCETRNMPVITVNTDISHTGRLCFVGQDGYKAGRTAGRLMGEFLQGRGMTAVITSDGKGLQYYPFGNREDGFRELLLAEYPGIELLPSVCTEESAALVEQSVRNLMQRHPDLNGIYLTCGGAGTVVRLIKQSGRDNLVFLCFEDYPEILTAIREGFINATLDSGLVRQGSKALQILLDRVIYGKLPPQEFYYTDIRIIIKENI